VSSASDRGPADMLEIGRIGRPHGVLGELYVDLSTDRTERMDAGSVLHARGQRLTVSASRQQAKRWLVRFEEINDRTTAERFSSATLSAAPIDDPDALWVHDLIGARVVELDGTDRGTCVAVIENPAAELLELDSGALVPVTFVVRADDDVVTIDPPDGLFD
jgi:16S rRNA processing protein RimM